MSVTAMRKSKLLAVDPVTVEPFKPKVLVFGPPGVGKTWASLDAPGVFYIDTEGGADLNHYRAKLKASGGGYLGPAQGSLDFETVIGQIEALATEHHPYRTIVLDSITKLFSAAIVDEQSRMASEGKKDEFGASKKGPVRQMARLVRWINRSDMNVILIAHQKDMWGKDDKGNREIVGMTFDAWEKLEYELHLVLRIAKIGAGENAKRFAYIGKSRLQGFPEGQRFDWSFESFAERYGKDVIEKEVKPIVLASAEQVAELRRLLELVKLPDGTIEKWLKKAEVETFEEMDAEMIGKCLSFLEERVKGK